MWVPGFLIRRIGAGIATLFVISVVTFALLDLAPGNTAQLLLGNQPTTPSALQAVRVRYHLNDPLYEQYFLWLGSAVRLQFGSSLYTGQPVTSVIASDAPVTIELAVCALVLSLLVGVPLGVLAALKRQTWIDRTVVGTSVLGVSAPAFATGLFLLYVFAVLLNLFPAYGLGSGVGGRAKALVLPVITLALTQMALMVKLTRAAMIEALGQDSVVFARARGLSEARIIRVYGLRNALVPIITAAGNLFVSFIAGTILVEVTFSLPGIGALLIQSINEKDIPVVQCIVLLIAAVVIGVNILTDVAYVIVDPRMRLRRTTV